MIRPIAILLGLVLAGCQPATPSSPPGLASPSTSTPPPAASAPSVTRAPAGSPAATSAGSRVTFGTRTYEVTRGAHPHDVAPASDGGVWYTGQLNGTLGWLDPDTGAVREVRLPAGAAPHGVITGPDGAAWVTDQGLDAIVRVTPGDFQVDVFPVPDGTAPHTAVFDPDGILWFTGATGWIGRLDPRTRDVRRFPAPGGPGPYGITVTPSGEVWFVSLQQSYLGRVDGSTGDVAVVEPPTKNAGTRRVWSDSRGRLWVSYWNTGDLAVYDPAVDRWSEWDTPGEPNQAYSMYVDDQDVVWLSDFGQNAIVRFDPSTETFDSFPSDRPNAAVRQMLGRGGEVWGAESGLDRLVVVRTLYVVPA